MMARGSETQRAGIRESFRQSPGEPMEIQIARYVDREIRRLKIDEMQRRLADVEQSYISKTALSQAFAGIKQRAISAIDASAVDATYGTQERDVIISLRNVLTEVIAALKAAGITA